jgi:hypothetical protein
MLKKENIYGLEKLSARRRYRKQRKYRPLKFGRLHNENSGLA